MEELLRKYAFYGQADVVLKLAELSSKEGPIFWEHLKGIGLWGGVGSVCDVNFIPIAQNDMAALRRALLEVATIMEQKGQTTPRVLQMSRDLKSASKHL